MGGNLENMEVYLKTQGKGMLQTITYGVCRELWCHTGHGRICISTVVMKTDGISSLTLSVTDYPIANIT
jgi:hypothetical protein